jgi:hypothetical protein
LTAEIGEEVVPNVPDIGADDSDSLDQGQQEALSLGRGLTARDLRREADEADHDRNERFKGHFDNIGVIAMYAIAIALLIAGAFWFWHIVTPWHFLEPDQLTVLQNMLTGGVLVSVGTSYMKKRLG